MNKIAYFITNSTDRKAVSAYYSRHVSERTNLLEGLYKISSLKFETSKTNVKEKMPLSWTDANEIVNVVLRKRNFLVTILLQQR